MDEKEQTPQQTLPTGLCLLVTSIGKKVPLLSALRKALTEFSAREQLWPGRLLGGDCDANCLGRYFVDHFVQLPADGQRTLPGLLDVCRQWGVNAIIPTRDAELPFFARHKAELAQAGITVHISDLPAVTHCLDKLLFSQQLLQAGFAQTIPTAIRLADLNAPSFVVKERYGAGSNRQRLNLSHREAAIHADSLAHPIFQPYIKGREFSVDLYLDARSQPLGTVVRSRDLIVNGEAQITTTVDHPDIEELCNRLTRSLKLTGHQVIQLIVDDNEQIHLLECNCRFGGASTLSFAAGLPSLMWFFCAATGRDLKHYPFIRSPHPLRQIRHLTDWVIPLPAVEI
ncbi:MAG: ATP-grasp domain-containing protein [Desulfuromonadaceae bacterium]|nr:ATP-grasp domain-containing protein [Desulfuromonadaceae bacterium]